MGYFFYLLLILQSFEIKVDSLINRGDKLFSGSISKTSDAYLLYDKALSVALNSNDPELIFKASYKMLRVLGSNNSHYNKCQDLFIILENHSNSKSDSLYIQLERIRFDIQTYYSSGNFKGLIINNFEDLIATSTQVRDLTLELELRILYGVYLELTKLKNKEAKEQYDTILSKLQDIELSDPLLNILFVCKMNLGKVIEPLSGCQAAIKTYNEALLIDAPKKNYQNLLLLYQWITDCYRKLGQTDSAYHYMQLTHQTLVDSEKRKHDVSISDLEEKYQNEKLTNDLSKETIKRKQSYITSLSLGGLLTLSLLGLYGFRRINKLKQTTLQQQIKETQQQGQLAAINAQLDGEEQERKRVAATLHDGIASHLTAASFHLQTISQQNDSTQAADKAAQLIVEAAERTRQLSHELYPPVLIKDGLVPALSALINTYYHSELTFHLEDKTASVNIDPDQETKIYYIIVELLQNVIKHSQASSCTLILSSVKDLLTFSITDDGVGIKDPNQTEGLGLNSIRARLANMSGSLDIQNNSPQGTKVLIYIPLS